MRSLSTSCHQIARFNSFEKKTQTPYVRPQNVVSTMRTVFCGVMFGSNMETRSSLSRTQTCDRFAAPASCFSVCLPSTYSDHSLSRIFFPRRDAWNDREHSRHRYHCTPLGEPFFLVNREPHDGHVCPLF